MKHLHFFTRQNLGKKIFLYLKLSVVLGVFFAVIFQQLTVYGFLSSIGVSVLYSFGLGLGSDFLNRFLSLKWNWVTQTNQRLWAGILSTVLYTVPVVLGINYVLLIWVQGIDTSLFFSQQLLWVHLFYVILSLGISAVFHARGFMMNWKASTVQENTQQQIVAKTASAQFETLKNQIDPHFLFNSLNVLTALIDEDPKQAERFTTKLATVYRYVLEQRNKELVPLAEELEFAKTYIELLQMRFEEAIHFQISVPSTDDALKIVPLSLQLLLENAVKHNVLSVENPLRITIYKEGDFLCVENSLHFKKAIGSSTKVGLQNISDRYGLISKKTVSITKKATTFVVKIPLLTKTMQFMKTSRDYENSQYVKAVEHVRKLKEFYGNITAYLFVIPFLIYINLRFSPQFHWFWFPMFGWGMGVFFHWLEVYNYRIFLGKNWENKKIAEFMKEDEEKNTKNR